MTEEEIMNDLEFESDLIDRDSKIKAVNEQLDLDHNSYVAISGGLDSTIASFLLDYSLPNNNIPRVFQNTGIEYIEIVKFVKEWAKRDKRIIILNQKRNIKKTLKQYGYPFKSKEHAMRVNDFNRGSEANYIKKYITGIDKGEPTRFKCPKILLYQFEERGKYNYSRACCYKLKKEQMHQWEKENKKTIVITGMKKEEGGNRRNISCLSKKMDKFHPLAPVSEAWEWEFVKRFNIDICKLYYPPYNFKRTGCKGCPNNEDIFETLETLKKLLPKEYKQCWHLWKPVYNEYIRIGYRLPKDYKKED